MCYDYFLYLILYNDKANKATTLSEYGITNAYTKTEMDIGTAFSNDNWCLKKCGGLAILMITGAATCNTYGASTIPSGYRPKITSNACIYLSDNAGNRYNGYTIIRTSGSIQLYLYKGYSTDVAECTTRSDLHPYGQICWCVA